MAVMLTCVLMWLGRRAAARAIYLTLDLALDPVLLLFPPLLVDTRTTSRHIGFGVTTTPILSFGGSYIITQVYSVRSPLPDSVLCFLGSGGGEVGEVLSPNFAVRNT